MRLPVVLFLLLCLIVAPATAQESTPEPTVVVVLDGEEVPLPDGGVVIVNTNQTLIIAGLIFVALVAVGALYLLREQLKQRAVEAPTAVYDMTKAGVVTTFDELQKVAAGTPFPFDDVFVRMSLAEAKRFFQEVEAARRERPAEEAQPIRSE